MPDFKNLVKLVLILDTAYNRIAVIKYILTSFWSIGGVNTTGNHICHDCTVVSKTPFRSIETKYLQKSLIYTLK